VEYAVDRVDTTATIWLGLTIGCARCHNHKYDPITQREFYQVMAFFNNLPERGRVAKEGNSAPLAISPTRQMAKQLEKLEAEIAGTSRQLMEQQEEAERSLEKWASAYKPVAGDELVVDQDLAVRISWDDLQNPWVAEPAEEPARLAVPEGQGEASFVEGVQGKALQTAAGQSVEAGEMIGFSADEPITLATWVQPLSVQTGTIMSILKEEENRASGFSWKLVENRVQVSYGPRWLDDAIIIRTRDPLPVGRWSHLAIVHDGTQLARGLQLYVNGKR
jgi:hypothetical protein